MLATDIAIVAPAPLTIDEKEQRIRDMLIQEGRDAFSTGQDTNWRIGRAAVKYVETFALDADGKVDEKKKKPNLREYAVGIGMYDNTHRIYELHDVAAFWPASAQAHFKDVTWSRFRECSRHGLTLSQASTILHQHGEAPVAKIRKVILETHPKPTPPKAERVTFDCIYGDTPDGLVMGIEKWAELDDLILTHPGATLQLIVTWTETRDG